MARTKEKAWGNSQGAGCHIIVFGQNVEYMKGVRSMLRALNFRKVVPL